MTHPRTTPQAARPGLPRLRPVVSCGVRAAALLALACFASLLVPLCFDVSSFTIKVQSNQAYADVLEGENQKAYIAEMANESGLSSSEFVATTIGTLSAVTGVVITKNPGVRLIDEALGENLASLSSAAAYPEWDTLDDDAKSAYGTQENYNATKYVSLLDAFDLKDGYERFNSTGSSGGGFVFTDEERNRLNRIGTIGNNWKNRIGQTFGNLADSLTQDYRNKLYKYLYGEGSNSGNEISYEGEKPQGWGDSWYIYYKSTNVGWVEYRNNNNYWKTISLNDTYLIINKSPYNSSGVSNFYWFSKAPFSYAGSMVGSNLDAGLNPSTTAQQYTSQSGNTFYYGDILVGIPNPIYSSSQTISFYGTGGQYTEGLRYIEEQILFGDSGSGGAGNGELTPDIIDYPTQELPANTDVYYPDAGISPSTTWNQYITVQRPENPFNPDDQTSKPEWQQETKQNIQGLQGIHFDKLFPFCLYYDLQKFWQKVQSICGIQTSQNGTISTQASSVYDEIELRLYIPGVMDDTWTFDLEPLRNLLLIVKPFMLVFLIGVEIISLIMLWKGILTGQ